MLLRLIFFCLLASLCSILCSMASAQMEYVPVQGQDGTVRKFSRLIMGTDHLKQASWVQNSQTEPTDEQVFAVLDEAVRRGINVIDTSPIYVGNIENLVGRWLQRRKEIIKSDDFYVDKNLNPDRRIYVISKGGFPFDLFYSKELAVGTHSDELKQALKDQKILPQISPPGDGGQSPQLLNDVPPGTYASRLFGDVEQIKQRVSVELGHTTNNLNDFITVYLMHRDDFDSIRFNVIDRKQTPVETIMEALSSSEVAGKFAMLGWSNWTTDRVNESLHTSQSNPALVRPIFNSPYFSLFEMGDRSIHARGIQATHDDMMDPNFQKGMFINSYSPLGGFSILDKPFPSWESAKEDARKKYEAADPYWQNVYHAIFTSENEVRYKQVSIFVQKFNQKNNTAYTVDQAINAYALAHTRTDFLTVGPISVEEVRRTVNSLPLSKKLTTHDLDHLYKVDARLSGQIRYSRQIVKCSAIF